jgi:glutamyl-tRNA synthetase
VTTYLHHFKRTRIAPTPSGYLHLGNVLSFAITASLAEKTGAKILLRIDDLDRDRVNKEYVQDIFDTLNFLEIPWHEGPRNYEEFEKEYSQLHRMDFYREALQQLREKDAVFACACSRSQIRLNNPNDIYPGICRNKGISLDAKDISWRLKIEANKPIVVNTLTDGIIKTTLPASMNDFVVRKKGCYPAYQLASLIDDIHFGVDLIVRGQDLWPSTFAQLYLSSVLNKNSFSSTTFHHHRLLTDSGVKLSKSAGDTSVKYLREHGKKPADVYTEITRMLGSKECISSWQQIALLYTDK